jgi:adenosylhomocysteine nucleosidase
VKEFLSRAGVAFEARNVDEDTRAYDDLLARGFRSVPVTVIGDRIVKGFDPAALKSALEALPKRDGGAQS